jgi:hypothetical protein
LSSSSSPYSIEHSLTEEKLFKTLSHLLLPAF